ncbi:unnamed protein product, partial [Prorocentrum cordatum]
MAMIDVARPLWPGAFDQEIAELAQQELQNSAPGFVGHACLTETSQGAGAKCRAFVAACAGGPTPADPDLDANLGLLGASELGDEQKEELAKLQGQLKQLRRTTVKFFSLPSVGAASGAECAVAQLQCARGALSLGHRFARKKTDVRALILSAELFPPNIAKQGVEARLSEQVACDEAKFKRVVEFFAQKRQKDDIPIPLDGRSRANRRVIESFEKKFESGGSHSRVECWLVHEQPGKKEDPRPPARARSYTKNNKETAIFSMPLKGPQKLPRMNYETKTSILGAASCASVDAVNSARLPRLQGGVDSKGHPFSYSEVKPISLWQTIMEHQKVTRIVDFTPGSGALAVAASGAMECEGVASNDAHRDWLDSIVDRCAMCKAGHEDGRAQQLGGDAEFAKKASKFFRRSHD